MCKLREFVALHGACSIHTFRFGKRIRRDDRQDPKGETDEHRATHRPKRSSTKVAGGCMKAEKRGSTHAKCSTHAGGASTAFTGYCVTFRCTCYTLNSAMLRR